MPQFETYRDYALNMGQLAYPHLIGSGFNSILGQVCYKPNRVKTITPIFSLDLIERYGQQLGVEDVLFPAYVAYRAEQMYPGSEIHSSQDALEKFLPLFDATVLELYSGKSKGTILSTEHGLDKLIMLDKDSPRRLKETLASLREPVFQGSFK
jgi:hypothetical protein